MSYLAIEDYGIIGNMRTAALVGKNGSLDWLCWPRFDSPSIFASVLDSSAGGEFSIWPGDPGFRSKQYYVPRSNTLVTEFWNKGNVLQIQDCMPVRTDDDVLNCVVRKVTACSGRCRVRVFCKPAFDFARALHTVQRSDGAFVFRSAGLSLALASNRQDLEIESDAVTADFVLEEEQSAIFILQEPQEKPHNSALSEIDSWFDETAKFWNGWLGQCNYSGHWREMVERSALTLKLLTHRSGAVIAAPTTSLPESVGHGRNWDYRYVWVRDASWTVRALARIGFEQEAANFIDWLLNCVEDNRSLKRGPLNTVYTIDGATDLVETELKHLAGYRHSQPVRVGNQAAAQLQLDIYGELLEAVYSLRHARALIVQKHWAKIRALADWVSLHWMDEDEGIWELRNGRHRHVFSQLLCWVALDRAIKLSHEESCSAPIAQWDSARSNVREQIQNLGWSQSRQSFVQSFQKEHLDGSTLMMSLVGFLPADHPKMLSTINAVSKPLDKGGLSLNGFIYRYNNELNSDGLAGQEGTFNICSFWLVQALARAGSNDACLADRALLLLEKLKSSANELGLYSEQTGASNEMLGNFPQALSHLGLINALLDCDACVSQH